MAGSDVRGGGQDSEDESEWEYELDPTETDTFYVTLDLSHATNRVGLGKSSKTTNATSRGKPVQQQGKSAESSTLDPKDGGTGKPLDHDSIQILGLHTNNPIIAYGSQLFSCDWTQTVGTDMLFCSAPRSGPDFQGNEPQLSQKLPFEPMLAGNGWALLTTTSSKLVARPVKATPKDGRTINARAVERWRAARKANPPPTTVIPTPSSQQPIEEPSSTSLGSEQKGNVSENQSHRPVTIPLGIAATHEKQTQAYFLERLIKAKQARGETDRVFLGKQRQYEDGWKYADAINRGEKPPPEVHDSDAEKGSDEDVVSLGSSSDEVDVDADDELATNPVVSSSQDRPSSQKFFDPRQRQFIDTTISYAPTGDSTTHRSPAEFYSQRPYSTYPSGPAQAPSPPPNFTLQSHTFHPYFSGGFQSPEVSTHPSPYFTSPANSYFTDSPNSINPSRKGRTGRPRIRPLSRTRGRIGRPRSSSRLALPRGSSGQELNTIMSTGSSGTAIPQLLDPEYGISRQGGLGTSEFTKEPPMPPPVARPSHYVADEGVGELDGGEEGHGGGRAKPKRRGRGEGGRRAKRARRAKRGGRAMGGLFRDYIPTPEDQEGAEICRLEDGEAAGDENEQWDIDALSGSDSEAGNAEKGKDGDNNEGE